MADLQFVDFALMPAGVRKEKQFGLPDENLDVTILSRTSHPASGFSQHRRTAVRRSAKSVLHNEGEARNFEKFQHFPFSEVEIVAY